ncbi:MAG: methyltransferase domain-containing protein [Firmicutes bacterium]|nr:methyltransferase domain-containing protein [Bacillota bacterium]
MPIDKERTINCYNAMAPIYSFFRKFTYHSGNVFASFVLDALDPQDGDVVLDAGTGPGIYAITIAQRTNNAKVYGVDLSPKFLDIAKKNADEAGLNGQISFVEGDLENLPFDNHHFNKLVCAGAIEAVPDRKKAAGELYRVLKPGGRAVVIEPDSGKNIRDRAFLFLLYCLGVISPNMRGFSAEDMPKYYFNRDSFSDLFTQAGFKTVKISEQAGSFCAVCLK